MKYLKSVWSTFLRRWKQFTLNKPLKQIFINKIQISTLRLHFIQQIYYTRQFNKLLEVQIIVKATNLSVYYERNRILFYKIFWAVITAKIWTASLNAMVYQILIKREVTVYLEKCSIESQKNIYINVSYFSDQAPYYNAWITHCNYHLLRLKLKEIHQQAFLYH
mgnify:CR=1 FL=1